MRTFFTWLALALAMALVTPLAAEARTHRHHAAPAAKAFTAHQPCCGPYWHRQPDDVVQDGWVIGRDPDPFIRGEILRDSGGGGPG